MIQLEGDSVGLGLGASDRAFTPAGLLAAAFPAATIIQTSIGGTTSFDRIDGTNGYKPFPQGIVGNIYLTEFGGNDARHGEHVSQFKDNIRKIASVPGAILETPIPLNLAAPLSEGQSTAAYAQAVREVGIELGVPVADVQAYILSLPNWQSLLAEDRIHPSDALYRMMFANVIVPVVARQVAALQCR